jgi:hypothetical protein
MSEDSQERACWPTLVFENGPSICVLQESGKVLAKQQDMVLPPDQLSLLAIPEI